MDFPRLALLLLLAAGTLRLAWHLWNARVAGPFAGPDLHPPPEIFGPHEPVSQRLVSTIAFAMLAVIVYSLAATVALLCGAAVAAWIDPAWVQGDKLAEPARTIVGYIAEDFGRLAGGVGTLLLIAVAFTRSSVRSIGWSLERWPRGVVAGVDAFVSVYPICFALVLFASQYIEAPQHVVLEQLRAADSLTGALLIFTAVVVAPVAEETLFRGWLQSGLRSVFEAFAEDRDVPTPQKPDAPETETLSRPGARLAAIVLSSVCFAAVHVPYWHAMPALFALSLCLGLLFERRGTLTAPITLHVLFNAWNVAITLAGGDA